MNNNHIGVAVKAVIGRENKYLVLIKSDQDEVNPSTYDLPGGRINFGEQPNDAVLREISEEISLIVEEIKPFEVWSFIKGNLQLVGINYLCKYRSGEINLSGEHLSAEWIEADKVINDPKYPEWLRKTLQQADAIRLD